MAQTRPASKPSTEDIEELLQCARYGDEGDLESIQAAVEQFGAGWLAEAKDDRGNTMLHLSGANGHDAIVSYLLPLLPPSALVATNEAGSTPLHWISLNYHLATLKQLCPLLPRDAFDLRNAKGKTAVQEAEEACEAFVVPESEQEKKDSPRAKERVRREVVVGYLLQCMGLGVKKPNARGEAEPEEADGDGDGDEVAVAAAAGEGSQDKETMNRLAKEAERLKLEGKAP